eukprot:c29641_g1_i1 orf=130-1548(+)
METLYSYSNALNVAAVCSGRFDRVMFNCSTNDNSGSKKWQRGMQFVTLGLAKRMVIHESKVASNTCWSYVSRRTVQAAASTSDICPSANFDVDKNIKEKIQGQPPLHIDQFYLPELHCCFPAKSYPELDGICEEIFLWVSQWKHFETEEERELLRQSNLPGIFGWTVPYSARRDRMLLAGKLATSVCMFDDLSDQAQQLGAEANSLRNITLHITAVLEGHDSNHDLAIPEVIALSSILRQLRANMSPRLYQRHADAMISGLLSFETQADRRATSAVPDLPTYILDRRNAFWFDSMEVIIEYCLGVELDEETLHMESMQELHKACSDYMAWTNDLISFRTEYFQGDLQNLLSVVHFDIGGNLDFQYAVNKAIRMIQTRERDFVRILHQISLSEVAARKPDLRLYLRNLPYALSGHLHWLYSSPRFHGIGHTMAESRQGIVQMDPDKTVLLSLQDQYMASKLAMDTAALIHLNS